MCNLKRLTYKIGPRSTNIYDVGQTGSGLEKDIQFSEIISGVFFEGFAVFIITLKSLGDEEGVI